MKTFNLNHWGAATLIALPFGGAGKSHAQDAVTRLQPLVAASARRLCVAKRIALAKWDSGAPVEDIGRESQVMMSAAGEGQLIGLDPAFVSSFFKAQIEANKLFSIPI